MLIRSLIILMVFLCTTAHAVVPGSFTYQGQIIQPNGQSLEEASVEFTIEIYSPGVEECLLYQEKHTLNMSDSKGIFSIIVGSGSRVGTDYEDTSTLISSFDNTLPQQTPTTCDSVGTYTPASGDIRLVRVTFDAGSGPITVAQDHKVQSVPYAEYSSKLDGLDSLDFIKVNAGAGQELSQVNIDNIFTTANHSELLSLLAGTSNQYMVSAPSSSPDFNNQVVEGIGNPVDGDDATNKNYVDTNIGGAAADNATIATLGAPETGHVLYWDGAKWSAGSPAADGTKLPLVGGTMSGAINMGNSDITNIKDVAINNNLTVTGGIGVGTGINSSGPISLTAQNEIRFEDAADGEYVGFKAPTTVGSNLIWTLPAGDGSAGQVMATDASGNLNWANVAILDGVAGGQTFNGGLNASDNLTLDSTAHATKGFVLIQPTDGNVGIGTSNPNEKLHLYSTAVSSGSLSTQFRLTDTSNYNAGPQSGLAFNGKFNATNFTNFSGVDGGKENTTLGNTAGYLALHTASNGASPSERLRIDSSGNVGIGTTLPSGRLDVEGGDVFIGDAALTNGSADEDLKVKGNIEFNGVLYGDGSGLTNLGASALGAGSVGSSELINGDVQLIDMATDSVNSSKIVNGSITTSDIATDTILATNIATGAVGTLEIANGTVALADLATDSVNSSKIVNSSITASDLADDYVNVTGDTLTGTLNMGATNEIRYQDAAGGEYVGFKAPSVVAASVTYTLPDDDGAFSGYVLATDSSGNLTWNNPSAPADNMGNNVATAAANVQLNNNWLSNDGGAEGLQIDNAGDITISGTIAGNGSLLTNIGQAGIVTDGVGAAEIAAGAVGTSEIANGTVLLADISTASFDSRYLRGDTSDTMSGSLTATSFISTSDRRLKDNIETIPGLDVILNMRGVRFDWKSNGEAEIGLIAQEVETVMPELVVTNPKTGFKAVKYSNLVSPLIEATKDLYGMCVASQEDIEIHDRRIASLEKDSKNMKRQIQSLKATNKNLKDRLEQMDDRLRALEALMREK